MRRYPHDVAHPHQLTSWNSAVNCDIVGEKSSASFISNTIDQMLEMVQLCLDLEAEPVLRK